MKILIQRVSSAKVEIDGELPQEIDQGVLVFVGITHTDTLKEVEWLADKLIHLRLFEDENGKTNLSLFEKNAKALIISQFTLYADCQKGRRPSFTESASPEIAKSLYEAFIEHVKKGGIEVKTGVFGAFVKVSLQNEGPFTLVLESCKQKINKT